MTEERPLTKRERNELAGYVASSAVIGRAVMFVLAVGIVGLLAERMLGSWLPTPVWAAVPLAFGAFLFVRAGRWTGGADLRRQVRLDLKENAALVRQVRVADAIVFEEAEDEGPIVFIRTDDGATLVFTGQELARHVGRGFPWREFSIGETRHSRRFLGFERKGDPQKPSESRPPLSRQAYKQLGLDSVRTWKQLEMAFDDVRKLS